MREEPTHRVISRRSVSYHFSKLVDCALLRGTPWIFVIPQIFREYIQQFVGLVEDDMELREMERMFGEWAANKIEMVGSKK